MARIKVKLESGGLEEVAKSADMHREIDSLAEAVAENVRSQGHMVEGEPGDIALPVKVYTDLTTTDMRENRARAAVSLAHPAGQAVQAKNGALTKAAAQAGLEVKG